MLLSTLTCFKSCAGLPSGKIIAGAAQCSLFFAYPYVVHQAVAHAADWASSCLGRYIQAFQGGFDEGLKHVQLSFMQSDGGLSPVSSFSGHKAVLSGPAGGYVTIHRHLIPVLLSCTHRIPLRQEFMPESEFLSFRGRVSNLVGCRYVGYALTTQWEGQEASKLQMIGFDMGGTSTDVSRFAGSYEHVFESTTAGDL